MLQRVGIAQALINDPEVVFFDEPMSGLDPLGRREIRELILRLRDRGCTVFFSSHVLSDAEALCSRVAIVAAGRLVAEGLAVRAARVPRPRLGARACSGLRETALERVRRLGRVVEATAHRRRPLRAAVDAVDARPSRWSPSSWRHGAQLVSLNPLRDTLEDLVRPPAWPLHLRIAGWRRATSMRAISLVAVNVFRESVRDKVLYNLVAFAVLLIAASFLIGQLTAGQDIKIIKDLGLAAISLFGLLIAVFIGIGLVWKEVEKRSIYSVLSKPVRRTSSCSASTAGCC